MNGDERLWWKAIEDNQYTVIGKLDEMLDLLRTLQGEKTGCNHTWVELHGYPDTPVLKCAYCGKIIERL